MTANKKRRAPERLKTARELSLRKETLKFREAIVLPTTWANKKEENPRAKQAREFSSYYYYYYLLPSFKEHNLVPRMTCLADKTNHPVKRAESQ